MFSEREDLFSIENEPKVQKTMLTMWFKENKEYPKLDKPHTLTSPCNVYGIILLKAGRSIKKVLQLVDFHSDIQIVVKDII